MILFGQFELANPALFNNKARISNNALLLLGLNEIHLIFIDPLKKKLVFHFFS